MHKACWRGLDVAAKQYLEGVKEEEECRNGKQRKIDLGNEISILSSLRHPNIVGFFGACFTGDFTNAPVYLMEYCSRGSLETMIKKARLENRLLKEQDVARYIYEIALAIEFMHSCSQPIIHRDLKPDNVLLTAYNQVKITDFGLATVIPERSKTYEMTGRTGSIRVSL